MLIKSFRLRYFKFMSCAHPQKLKLVTIATVGFILKEFAFLLKDIRFKIISKQNI